jgi:phosphoglycerate dehydrogenase-like enzyme
VCYLAGSVRKLVERPHLEGGLTVTNWSGSISRVVAEGTLSLVLNALRNAGHWIPAMHRDGAWKDTCTQTRSLFQRKVGIHGFGRVTRELARLLQPFSVELSIYAPEKDPALYASHGARRAASLAELFSESDVVIELSPLIPATKGIITGELLRSIRPGCVFVNTARGELVDSRALEEVAREGRIQIGLDVYAIEPLPASSPLRGLPNVVLIPHLAGPTNDRRRDAGEFGYQNLLAYGSDRPLQGVITPEVFDTHSM